MKESLGFGPFSSQICSRDKAKRNELSTSFLFCVYTAIYSCQAFGRTSLKMGESVVGCRLSTVDCRQCHKQAP